MLYPTELRALWKSLGFFGQFSDFALFDCRLRNSYRPSSQRYRSYNEIQSTIGRKTREFQEVRRIGWGASGSPIR